MARTGELAGMSRAEFLKACGRYRVSVFSYLDQKVEEEIKKDFETGRIISCESYRSLFQ